MRKKTILAIGELLIDETIILKTPFVLGQKIEDERVITTPGGSATNAAIFLNKLGHDVYLFTSLGRDREGYWAKNLLEKLKIDLTLTPQSRTQKNIVLIDKKTNTRTIIKDSLSAKKIILTKKLKEIIQKADLIYLDRHQNHVFDFLLTYKKPQTEIIFDPSTSPSSRNLIILKQINFPIIPWEFLLNWLPGLDFSQTAERLINFFKKPVIITLDYWGSLLLDLNHQQFFPSYQIAKSGTNGAGDIFRAAFSHCLLEKINLKKAIDWCNRIVAVQYLKKGIDRYRFNFQLTRDLSLTKNLFTFKDFIKSYNQIQYDQSANKDNRRPMFDQ